jgi:hypothetical protein
MAHDKLDAAEHRPLPTDQCPMTRQPSTFRQRDLTAAIKAARAAGVEVSRIEIDKAGKIVIVVGKPLAAEEDAAQGTNEWDDVA